MLGKEKDEIDVGGEVELAAPEAHAEDDERLRLASLRTWHTMTHRQSPAGIVTSGDDCRIGNRRQVRKRLGKVRP